MHLFKSQYSCGAIHRCAVLPVAATGKTGGAQLKHSQVPSRLTSDQLGAGRAVTGTLDRSRTSDSIWSKMAGFSITRWLWNTRQRPSLRTVAAVLALLCLVRVFLNGGFNGGGADPEFSWMSYIQQNPDLYDRTYSDLVNNFRSFGKKRGRPYVETRPEESSFDVLSKQLQDYRHLCSANANGPYQSHAHNLVIYRIPRYDANAAPVTKLNLQLFLETINLTPCTGVPVFYVFNVLDGEDNVYYHMLPRNLPHVAILHWHERTATEEFYHHVRTMEVLGTDRLLSFGAIFLLNINLRGPMSERGDNQWVQTYRTLLGGKKVALVSPVGCDEIPMYEPHLHSYALGMTTAFAEQLLREFRVVKYTPSSSRATYAGEVIKLISNRENSLSVRLGYQYASIVQFRTQGALHYKHACKLVKPTMAGEDKRHVMREASPSWCAMDFKQQLFVPWGSNNVRYDEHRCANERENMRQYLVQLRREEPQLWQRIEAKIGAVDEFEMNYVDLMRDMFLQYRTELRLEQSALAAAAAASTALTQAQTAAAGSAPKVCFLVRTASMHDSPPPRRAGDPVEVFSEVDIFGFIRSLLKQSDPNWVAYLFLTDNKPFEDRLQQIVGHFRDPRVRYFDVDKQHRPAFTKIDGGYTATDYALKRLLQEQSCQWLSVTNGDNAYGSDVVRNVLRHLEASAANAADNRPAQMLLAPLDSRNFAALDYLNRHGIKAERDNGCKGINAMVELNQLAFTAQPIPVLARVDLAAIFLHRQSLLDTNLLFANFTDPSRYPCHGCQDGYLAETLIAAHSWRYVRLPLDGLRSIVFHGPSPTLCIASGNVWYDYPAVNKVGCFTRQTVHALRVQDALSAAPRFDWKNFDSTLGVCLRLSEQGFAQVPEEDLYLRQPPSKMLRKNQNSVLKLLGMV